MARMRDTVIFAPGVDEKPHEMICIAYCGGYEVWAIYDDSAGVIETFASEDGSDYLGCHDDMAEAKEHARDWIVERLNE